MLLLAARSTTTADEGKAEEEWEVHGEEVGQTGEGGEEVEAEGE